MLQGIKVFGRPSVLERPWLMAYVAPRSASWGWKQICNVKNMVKDGYFWNVWNAGAEKGYFVSSGYTWLSTYYVKLDWPRWVWGKFNLPKHSFICWFAMFRRKNTRHRLARFGVYYPNDFRPYLFKLPFYNKMLYIYSWMVADG